MKKFIPFLVFFSTATFANIHIAQTVYELSCKHAAANNVAGPIPNRIDESPELQSLAKLVDLREIALDIDKQIKLNCSDKGKDYRNPFLNVQKIFEEDCRPAKDLAKVCVQIFYARIESFKNFEKGATQAAQIFSKQK